MFSSIEKAIKGSPTEFYHFQRGATHWHYTSADAAQIYGSDTYNPTKLKRSAIKQGGGMSAEGLTITLPRDNALALTYIAFPTAEKTSIIIYGRHRNDSDGEVVHLWSGRVKNANFKGAAVELSCESILTTSRAQGLKRSFGANCSHVLYDQTPLTCGVIKAAFESSVTLASAEGVMLTATALGVFAEGYFAGGLLEWQHDGVTEYRMIMASQTGTGLFRLISPLNGLATGDTVKVYPGCNRTTDQCQNRFNNLSNYGGFPYVPVESPFGGTMVF
jgi:uncharacterized phage protein (TIGR02218 family)